MKQSSSKRATKSPELALQGQIALSFPGKPLAGKRRMALLQAIAQTGSISKAAQEIGMSYKAAWDAVESMNNLSPLPVCERVKAGKPGGGTALTEYGQNLVRVFEGVEQAQARFLAGIGWEASNFNGALETIRRFTLKTSARNHLYGKVVAVKKGAVNDEIRVALPGGDEITAIITSTSTQYLDLAKGSEVVVLIKSSSVLLAPGLENLKLSARNQLKGTISRIIPGAVNSEVVLELAGKTAMTAIVTAASVKSLKLVVGMDAVAIIKASSIILGIPG